MAGFLTGITQCGNNIAQSVQTSVNADSLLGSVSNSRCPLESFRTSKINKMEFAVEHNPFALWLWVVELSCCCNHIHHGALASQFRSWGDNAACVRCWYTTARRCW